MPSRSLIDDINSLTPEQQESVRAFVEFLKRGEPNPIAHLLSAMDEFIQEHPELLKRLAR